MGKQDGGLPQAVDQALTQALAALQTQLDEVQRSFESVQGALESARTAGRERLVHLLPALMRMQAGGAALAASIESVLRFVGSSAQWGGAPGWTIPAEPAVVAEPEAAPEPAAARVIEEVPTVEEPVPPPEPPSPAPIPEVAVETGPVAEEAPEPPPPAEPVRVPQREKAPAPAAPVAAAPPAAAVDVESLPNDLKELHRKARRFAKVTVQEFSMYKKDEVVRGRENKDLYQRFKEEIDKSKALYDKRFAPIASHHVDYLYDELVRVLAENDPSALGNYPHSAGVH